jgi:hypothetical protein
MLIGNGNEHSWNGVAILNDSTGFGHIFIGLQPIFNRELELYANELLFRSFEQDRADWICFDSGQ